MRVNGDGPPRNLPGVQDDEVVAGWAENGREVYVFSFDSIRLQAPVFRYDVTTGRKLLWTMISPVDTTGLVVMGAVLIASDGNNYVYAATRKLSQLYVVTGLK